MAVKMYTDAIRISPTTHTFFSNRSAAHCALHDYHDAFVDGCKCTDLMPAWPKGYVRKGAALHGMDRWSEAIKAYEAGLKFDPTNQALLQGIDDAKRRLALAGGEWIFEANHRSDGSGKMVLDVPIALCAAPAKGICVLDQGDQNAAGSTVRILNGDATSVKLNINSEQMVNRAGLFGSPQGVACDDAHVYVTDQMRCRIVKCTINTGKLVLAVGRSGSEDGAFDTPWGLAIADTSAGSGVRQREGLQPCAHTLFVSDSKNHRIVALDASDLSFRFSFGHWGYDDGELIEPLGIAVHADKLLVADGGNKRLCLFSLRGELIRTFGPDGPGSSFVHKPQSVALAADAIFCIETKGAVREDHRAKEMVPGRVHALCPTSGQKLRPPLAPPFSTSVKGQSSLTAVGVIRDALWVASSFGILMRLPRDPNAGKADSGGANKETRPAPPTPSKPPPAAKPATPPPPVAAPPVAAKSGSTHVSMILAVTTYGSMFDAGRRSSK